jgi:hypothetical protein
MTVDMLTRRLFIDTNGGRRVRLEVGQGHTRCLYCRSLSNPSGADIGLVLMLARQ